MRMIDDTPTPDSAGPSCPPPQQHLRSTLCRFAVPLAIATMLVLGVVALAGAQQSQQVQQVSTVSAGSVAAADLEQPASSVDPAILDFAQVQAGPISIEPDPKGTAALLEVSTSVDLVCAVVYGPDGSFGQIATDQDMNGGAHSQHHPLMTGLQPDTGYSYRLQGSDAQGNVYMSKTFTFRTPPAQTAGAPNLALGAEVIEVSSEYSDAFAGRNAIDGDPGTEWSTRGDGDGAYITLDLGSPQQIAAVVFRTRQMSDGSATTDTFRVTIDDQEFGPFPASGDPVSLDSTGQIVRFDAESTTGGNTGAVEIEVLGPADAGS